MARAIGETPISLDFKRIKVSEHVWFSETRCHCGQCELSKGLILPDPSIIALFEVIRSTFNLPIQISNCWRCEAHNKTAGGAVHSLHLIGSAMDINIPESLEVGAAYVLLDALVGDGGFGRHLNTRSVHIDAGHLLGYPPRRRWVR